jgi:hypothetical protein
MIGKIMIEQLNLEGLGYNYMNNIKLTKKEIQLILDHRKEEEEDLPKKQGFLKADLYEADSCIEIFTSLYYGVGSKAEIKLELNNLSKSIFECEPVLKKGAKFYYYGDNSRNGGWYDTDNYGIENADEDFAKKYLENISKYEAK